MQSQNFPTPVIEATALYKTYTDIKFHVKVLQDINLVVKRSETLAIIGPSGSGKSTLLHLLAGLDKPTKGVIKIDNKEINRMSERAKGEMRNKYLGFVYQFHHLLPEFSALENVCMPLLLRGSNIEEAKERAKEMLAKVGLSARLEHRPSELSGGERQRVAIARALVTQPACVLADEPTGNLDHKTAHHIYELILALNAEFNTAFIVVSHDLTLKSMVQRALLLQDGQLQQI